MELKLQENIKASVEVNGEVIINRENSTVYFDNSVDEDMYLYIKSSEGKEIKVRLAKDAPIIEVNTQTDAQQ